MQRLAIVSLLFVALSHAPAVRADPFSENRRAYFPVSERDILSDYADRRLVQTPDDREARRIENDWRDLSDPPGESLATPLEPGNAEWNAMLYRRALSFYERGVAEGQAVEQEIESTIGARRSIRDPLWWKAIDEQAALDRRLEGIRSAGAMASLESFRRAFETLAEMDSRELEESQPVVELRRRSMRRYSIEQVRLGNFHLALPVLERLAREPELQSEWPLHYHLSICYAASLRQARRNTGVPESQLREIRRLKNLHLLQAVELKYGRNSREFEQVVEGVRLEELGSPRSTD